MFAFASAHAGLLCGAPLLNGAGFLLESRIFRGDAVHAKPRLVAVRLLTRDLLKCFYLLLMRQQLAQVPLRKGCLADLASFLSFIINSNNMSSI